MKNASLYLLVGALTAGNLALRVTDDGPSNVLRTTTLEVGAELESAALLALLDEEAPAGATCELVIAFSPDCPHCRTAAAVEKANQRGGAYADPLWIAELDSPTMAGFVEVLAPTSRHEISAEAFASLEVTAVPAAYLVDGDNVIRWRGPYQGSETGEELAARCDAGAPQELMASAGVTPVGGSD